MIGFDISTASDIKLGSSSISALYFGSNKIWPTVIDYSQEYLTFESLEDNNTISWKSYTSYNYSNYKDIYISMNKSSWTRKTSATSGETLATLNKGDKLYIKGDNSSYANYKMGTTLYNYFASSGNFIAYGNIMSLINSTSFTSLTTLSSDYTFYQLFYRSKIVDASNLILPATTLSESCYSNMFQNCTSLTTAPELPATTLAYYCYSYMFKDCSSLTTAPELPATTLTYGCYGGMFAWCTSLNYIKMLATDISATRCLYGWVNNVASSGTFVKNSAATWNVTGTSGIPSGWTVQTASE